MGDEWCQECAGASRCDEHYAVYAAERDALQAMHDLLVSLLCDGLITHSSLIDATYRVGFENGHDRGETASAAIARLMGW